MQANCSKVPGLAFFVDFELLWNEVSVVRSEASLAGGLRGLYSPRDMGCRCRAMVSCDARGGIRKLSTIAVEQGGKDIAEIAGRHAVDDRPCADPVVFHDANRCSG